MNGRQPNATHSTPRKPRRRQRSPPYQRRHVLLLEHMLYLSTIPILLTLCVVERSYLQMYNDTARSVDPRGLNTAAIIPTAPHRSPIPAKRSKMREKNKKQEAPTKSTTSNAKIKTPSAHANSSTSAINESMEESTTKRKVNAAAMGGKKEYLHVSRKDVPSHVLRVEKAANATRNARNVRDKKEKLANDNKKRNKATTKEIKRFKTKIGEGEGGHKAQSDDMDGKGLVEKLLADINRQLLQHNSTTSDDIPNCLDPDGPQPVILMSLGRSGSSSTWQVIGALTGQETKSVEYTGSSREESIEFFNKIGPNDGGWWIMKYMCFMQKLFAKAGVVGFKWKPNRSILSMEASVNGLKLLGKLKHPSIKVVRSRRNLLDVLISRYKHKRSTEKLPAHCTLGDFECLDRQLRAGKGVELPTHKVVRLLKTLTMEENEVDKQLKAFDVPRIHASFDKLYYSDDVHEWSKIVQFLIGPKGKNLTIDKVRSAMKHSSTSYPSHYITIKNYEEIVNALNGTRFEKLLH